MKCRFTTVYDACDGNIKYVWFVYIWFLIFVIINSTLITKVIHHFTNELGFKEPSCLLHYGH